MNYYFFAVFCSLQMADTWLDVEEWNRRLDQLNDQIRRADELLDVILSRRDTQTPPQPQALDYMDSASDDFEREEVMSEISEATVPYYTGYVHEWEECSEADEDTVVDEWLDTYYQTPSPLAPSQSPVPPRLYRPAYLDYSLAYTEDESGW